MTRSEELVTVRRRLAGALGTSEVALDRVAVALALAGGDLGSEELAPASADVDSFEQGPAFACLGSQVGHRAFRRELATGYRLLLDRIAEAGDDPVAAIVSLVRAARGDRESGTAVGAVTLPVGMVDGRPISFTLNQESGRQTNGNTRITGEQGMGKSEFLLHLLAACAARAPEAGFLLLDYKGDLSERQEFVRATGATVVRPERDAVPINPFDVPPGMDRRLVPSSIAQVIASVGQGIGDVQRKLLRDGIAAAYEGAIPGTPSTTAIADAVHAVYELEGRSADSVTALLEELAELGLFATQTVVSFDDFLARRWIIDLSGLQHLRELVAFVLVGWLYRNVSSAPDAPLLKGRELRGLRHVVAIDEAHHYVRRRCQPLLELLRIGRSKGVPVFLSSQSLSDFRRFTELEELLPNNFILRHGRAPDIKTAQGALRLPAELARRAGDAITQVEQFCALTAVDPDLQLKPVHLHGFFAGQWKT
jgi:hypothetical protein